MKTLFAMLVLVTACEVPKPPKAESPTPSMIEATRLVTENCHEGPREKGPVMRAASLLEEEIEKGSSVAAKKLLLKTYNCLAYAFESPESAEHVQWEAKFKGICDGMRKTAWNDVDVLNTCMRTAASREEEVAIVQKVLHIEPQNADAHWAMASIYSEEGRIENEIDEMVLSVRYERDIEVKSSRLLALEGNLKGWKKPEKLKDVEREFRGNDSGSAPR